MNKKISVNSGPVVPQSFITKGKQRLKQHIDTVYLKNGDEFEVELFNPTNLKVLAKIELNGNSIGNGIILRPGERIFLERYLDEAKKFLFETYAVNGDNEEVKQAIEDNGDVVVKFYNEIIYYSGTVSSLITRPHTIWTTNTVGYSSNLTHTYNTSNSTSFNNLSLTSGTITTPTNNTFSSYVETGRVEKGSDSDQSFTYDNSSFNNYASTTNWWKIKPQSQKMVTIEDLATYCTECGTKRKKDNHKFCPHCGTKF
jgi:hypothetical protein